MRHGNLTLHGRHRTPPWTQLRLGKPLVVGSKELTVEGRVDWRVGDKIVVTSSSFYAEEVDELTVDSVTASADGAETLITTIEATKHHHLAAIVDDVAGANGQKGGLHIDMRAEVAVLSRDVVIEGDEESEKFMFGSVVMLNAPRGGSNFWIEQIEVRFWSSFMMSDASAFCGSAMRHCM